MKNLKNFYLKNNFFSVRKTRRKWNIFDSFLLITIFKGKGWEGFFFCTLNDHSGTSCTAATPEAQSPRKKTCLFVQKKPIVAGLKTGAGPLGYLIPSSNPSCMTQTIFQINLDKINFILKTVKGGSEGGYIIHFE